MFFYVKLYSSFLLAARFHVIKMKKEHSYKCCLILNDYCYLWWIYPAASQRCIRMHFLHRKTVLSARQIANKVHQLRRRARNVATDLLYLKNSSLPAWFIACDNGTGRTTNDLLRLNRVARTRGQAYSRRCHRAICSYRAHYAPCP